jgi:glycosyltransferase involved in cell wall biosynthesis
MELAVLMTCFNEEAYIKEAIDSILEQDFPYFYFYIIDDCSTDNTSFIVNSYNDKRIRYKKLDVNIGQTAALNYGISLIKEDYIIRMDADDVSPLDRFRKMLSFIKENNLDILGSFCYEFGKISNSVEIIKPIGMENIRNSYFNNTPFVHGSLIFKKSIFDRLGPYNENFSICADLDLYYRIYFNRILKFNNISQITYGIRRHSTQLTKNNRAVIETLIIKYKIIYKLLQYHEYKNLLLILFQIMYFLILFIRNICAKRKY